MVLCRGEVGPIGILTLGSLTLNLLVAGGGAGGRPDWGLPGPTGLGGGAR